MRTELFQHEMTGTSKVFGRKSKLNIAFDDGGARTDGSTIYLPRLPGGKDVSEETMAVMRGYVDHESGHNRHTDMTTGNKYLSAWQRAGNKTAVSLLQGLEDVRLERKVLEEYPGALRNLRATTKAVNAVTAKQMEEGGITDEQLAYAPAAAGLAATWVGRKDYGEETNRAFIEKLERVNPTLLRDVERWVKRLDDCTSTGDVCKLVEEIVGEIEKEPPAPEEQPQDEGQQGEGEGNDEGNDRSDAGDGQSGEEPETGDEGSGEGDGEGETQEDAEDKGKGKGGDGAGESQGEGDPQGAAEAEAETEGEGKTVAVKGGKRMPDGSPPPEVIEAPTIESALKQQIEMEGLSGDSPNRTYLANPSSMNADWFPHISMANGPVPNGVHRDDFKTMMNYLKLGKASQYLDLLSNMTGEVNVMRRGLERSLLAKAERDWHRNRESGKLDPRRFPAVLAGQRNVRKVRDESKEIDTALQIVVDLSGSMESLGKIGVARQCVIALCEAVGRSGVALEVIGFHSNHGRGHVIQHHMARKGKTPLGRLEPIEMPIFKAFEDRLVDARGPIYSLGVHALENNADGESLMMAYSRLKDRPEQRKVMLVLSDGNPAFMYEFDEGKHTSGEDRIDHSLLYQHVRDSVAFIEDQGVDCIGIGIMDESVYRFYPRAVKVDTVSDLSKVALGALGDMLLGREVRSAVRPKGVPALWQASRKAESVAAASARRGRGKAA